MQLLFANRWFLLALSAMLQVFIFPVAGPLPAWRAHLAWVALVPFLIALLQNPSYKLKDAAIMGYVAGFLWYLGTCYWIYNTMHVYGGLSIAMGIVVMVLFCLYLGLYHALFAVLLVYLRRAGTVWALLAAPFLWIAVELARARITGFPWNLLGYSMIDNRLLMHLPPIGGAYLPGFVIASVNALLASYFLLDRKKTWAAAGALVAMCVALSAVFTPRESLPQTTETAIALQPDIPAGTTTRLDSAAILNQAMRLTFTTQPRTVTLWPEAPTDFNVDDPVLRQALTLLASKTDAPLIANAVHLQEGKRGYELHNSAVFIDPQSGYVGRYDKMHLVPFGEYVPYAYLFSFADGLTKQVGNFVPGQSRTLFHVNGHAYGVFICYESIFGDEVRLLAKGGADVLINLSDDGWYGDSSAPFQHMNMVRMRAMENRRWVLRDTDNGITASIDPFGRVLTDVPRNRALAAALPFNFTTVLTFYTRFGDLFAYLCLLVTLLGIVRARTVK